jgi:hypothetical protein
LGCSPWSPQRERAPAAFAAHTALAHGAGFRGNEEYPAEDTGCE